MKPLVTLSILFSIWLCNANAQKHTGGVLNNGVKTKWTGEPFDTKVFIENRGQFDGDIPHNEKILYQAQLGKIAAYFTQKGVVYCYAQMPQKTNVAIESEKEERENEKPVIHYLYATWLGAEPAPEMLADEKQSYFYAYPYGKTSTIKTSVYKKITYNNLYPGIDVEYSFPENNNGIQYSLIIHPGADISKVKLGYSRAESISKDAQGNIIISSELGEIDEQLPGSNYKDMQSSSSSERMLSDTVESFSLGPDYDKTKSAIIVLWTTSTSFNYINAAFDLDYDNYGNVYAYGGSVLSYTQLVKFSNTGVKQWVFSSAYISGNGSNTYYGDMATDKRSGSTYLVEGAGPGTMFILKVNNAGILVKTMYNTPDTMSEYWRADFDECNNQLVIGGGGTTNTKQAATVDTNLNKLTALNILGVTTSVHDISLMTLDPYSNSCFMATAAPIYVPQSQIAANKLVRLPLPLLSPTKYMTNDGYGFKEIYSVSYIGYAGGGNGGITNTNAMNGAAASPDWVYLYNGDSLKQFNKATGALHAQVRVSNAPFRWGGLAVDACDNIYVGNQNTINVYNSGLVLQSTISMPDTVYDIQLGPGNTLFACGMNFVTAFTISGGNSTTTTFTLPSACSLCNGKATINPPCGQAPFTYLWSDGSTNQTDTGLCAGVYTVMVTDASCPPVQDTAIVNISGGTGYGATFTHTPPGCNGTKGSLTVNPTGTTSPYTFLWSNGETTQQDTGLVSGMYNCTITNGNGCKYTTSTTLFVPPSPVLSISPPVDSVCIGASVALTVSGANTYTWTPSAGLNCTNCPNPVATASANTIYTVTGTDSLGCVNKDSVHIVFSPQPSVSIQTYPYGCKGTELDGSGAAMYKWLPGTGLSCSTCQNTISNDSVTITYTLVGTRNGCADSVTVTVAPNGPPTVTLTAGKDTICPGDSVELIAMGTGGITRYSWSNYTGSCSTCPAIYVTPAVTTTYYVYAYDAASCYASAAIRIFVGGISVTSNPGVCGQPTYLFASGSTSTYKWVPATGLSCTTCSNPVATPSVTTTYTVYGTGAVAACPKGDSAVVVVHSNMPQPISIVISKDTICTKDTVSLSVSGAYIKSVIWSPSTGLSCSTCINTQAYPIATTTYSVNVTDSSGCILNSSATIYVGGVSVTAVSGGCGSPTYLAALGSASYTWYPSTALSCTNCAAPVASPTTTITYTVHGTTSVKVCPGGDSAEIVVRPNIVYPLSITVSHDTICPGDTILLSAIGSGISSVTWTSGSSPLDLSCATCASTKSFPTATTTYYANVTDSGGCTVNASVTVYVESVGVTKSANAICLGDTLQLTTVGSKLSNYSWSPAAGLSCYTCPNPKASPAATTTYTLTCTDSMGCSVSATILVYVSDPPVVTITTNTGKNTVCANSPLGINATIQYTIGNIHYYWSPSQGLSCNTCSSVTVTPAVSATYTVTVTTYVGCPGIDSIPITALPVPPSFPPESFDYCKMPGVNDSVRLDTLASGPYIYSWYPTNGLSCSTCASPMASPSASTNYYVAIFDSTCYINVLMSVEVDTMPAIYPVSYTENICQGGTTNINTGIPYSSYKFVWLPSVGLSCSTCNNPTASPAYSTTYTLAVSNGKCVLDTTYPVIVFHPVINATQSTVCPGDTAVLTATVLNAAGSTTYDWTTGDYTSTLVVEPLTTTTYSVGIRNGTCYFDTTMTVTVGSGPNADISGLNVLCAGDSTTLTANGGYSYVWSTGTTASSLTVKPLNTISYTLKVSNGTCTKDTTITITVNPLPIGAVTGSTAICADSSTTLTASGGSSYYWSTSATTSSITVSPTTSSTYNVVVSQNGCADTVYTHVTVNAAPLITVCCDTSITSGKSVQLTSSGGGAYLWSPSNSLSCSTCFDPVASPTVNTIYTLTVTSDSGGCSAQQIITIDITCGAVFVPDVFSPNGDGQNDYLYVRGDCIKTLQFEIFDRWGNKVFETFDQNLPWDGRYRGEAMNTGSYVYYLSATLYDGTTQTKKGNVTLVR
ncbi:MAG TPA: gliding motility-associated C-terminal domain-containing protein [Bacteroidia bacterium]|nr:gliding motility-associated C-terminal domain-containing protein [Bacteroidia bacterium]